MNDSSDAGTTTEILLGLTADKKTLSSKLLYDATGSELFQRITELPEYYLTRTEKKLLGERAADIVAAPIAQLITTARHRRRNARRRRARAGTGGIRGER